ncbi:MAG: ACT domain-containing protein [Candidatus Methanomethylicaceae archaeon]
MAHEQEIMKIDSKGRLTIPAHIREELGMKEGAYAAVRMNREDRSVVVSLFAGAQARLVELRLMIPDRPGALARAAKALSEFNIDLLSSNSRTIKKGELAEWIVVADVSQAKIKMGEIKSRMIAERAAISMEIKELRL